MASQVGKRRRWMGKADRCTRVARNSLGSGDLNGWKCRNSSKILHFRAADWPLLWTNGWRMRAELSSSLDWTGRFPPIGVARLPSEEGCRQVCLPPPIHCQPLVGHPDPQGETASSCLPRPNACISSGIPCAVALYLPESLDTDPLSPASVYVSAIIIISL